MSDRPEYGEYATPEEQAAAAGTPWQPPHPSTRVSADGVPPQQQDRPAPRSSDSIVTLALLALGAYNAFSYVQTGLDLPRSLDAGFAMFGIADRFNGSDAARAVGYAVVAVALIGYVITAVLSVRRMRSGRLSFWVPIVGGLIVTTVLTAMIGIVASSDPALAQWTMAQAATTPSPTSTP